MRKDLKSGNISYCEYNEETQSLEVGFQSGSVYAYAKVDKEAYEAFIGAKSHGTFLSKNIKGKFKHSKVDKKKKENNGRD